jgi:hypothetical protein
MSRTLQFRRLGTATLANTTGANGELIINTTNKTLTVHDGTTPGGFALLNEATEMDIDQYARNTANTATSDITIIQGVNTTQNTNISILQGVNATQNTNITTATNLAQAAFNAANSASSGTIDQYARNTANTNSNNISIIQGVDNTQNTNITTVQGQALAAFTQANSNYTSAVTKLDVINSGSSAYLIDQYTGNNPSIYVSGGETIAFNLNVSGHPFLIRESSGGVNTSNGLIHISTTGVVSTGASAQGQVTGVLYWKIPYSLVGNTYVYQCSVHGSMVGNIIIQQSIAISTLKALTANAATYADFQTAIAAL